MRRSRWIGWDAAAAPDGDIKTQVRLVPGSIWLSVIEPNQTTKKATGGMSETGWLPVGLLVLLLLGSAGPALAEFGFDMARITPEASATDHDPFARRDGSCPATPASLSRARYHGGLRSQMSRVDAHEPSPG